MRGCIHRFPYFQHPFQQSQRNRGACRLAEADVEAEDGRESEAAECVGMGVLRQGGMRGKQIMCTVGGEGVGDERSRCRIRPVEDDEYVPRGSAEDDTCDAAEFKAADLCEDIQSVMWIGTVDLECTTDDLDLVRKASEMFAPRPVTSSGVSPRIAATMAALEVVFDMPISPGRMQRSPRSAQSFASAMPVSMAAIACARVMAEPFVIFAVPRAMLCCKSPGISS